MFESVFMQIAVVCVLMQLAFAAKGPVAEPVCDEVCPDTFPIEDNLHLPYTGDCSKFCHCANDGNWMKVCPGRLHFNPKLQVCDWPHDAGCEATSEEPSSPEPTQKPTATPTDAPSDNPCDEACPNVFPITHNNHLPYPGDCSKFCHCANDGNHIKECPDNLHFNPVLEVCDWPHSAGCDASQSTSSVPPTSAPPVGCDHVTCGIHDCFQAPSTTDCQAYCDCDHGEIIGKECSEGLHFNPVTEDCDFPTNANCELPIPPNGCEHVKCEAHDCFKTENTIDCNLYCDCDHGNLTIVNCSAGLHFNPESKACDFPWNAKCEVVEPNPGTDPTPPSAPSQLCDSICPDVWPVVENNHLFPGDCTKFCHCANDGNWLKDCPEGLHFNAELQVCDWPHSAGCQA